ncbi:TlpA family protein disulfide reductase [Flavobacterium sp. C4GT6]|uniref:TlpA family protein disulfide reductase n=1 Tax=Flavobacterium sp. C4GT6 TaxID=3103818 RepID=UPI002ED3A49B
MKIKISSTIVFFLWSTFVFSQTIKGSFPQAKKASVILKSYDGFNEQELARTNTDSLGNFILTYPKTFKGAALLQVQNVSSVIVLLNQESFKIKWDNLQDFKTLEFMDSYENESFEKGVIINQEAEQKLSGLRYLLPLYKSNKRNESWIKNEIYTQEQIFEVFINELPKNSYVKEYLTVRKLLGDLQFALQQGEKNEQLMNLESDFKNVDFASDALWHSGLLKDLIESFYELMQVYKNNDSIAEHIIQANKALLESLNTNVARQQEIAEFCFVLLEKKNITAASKDIALLMLDNSTCQLNEKQKVMFEQYRKLAIGATAPDIDLNNSIKLSDIPSKYKLIVFGASWCPNCNTDYPSLVGRYKLLKEQFDLEIIYLAIDTDIDAFNTYYKEAPFITYCDGKGWETQAIKDYYIFATPTYILLDDNLKIVAKLKSPEDISSWFNLHVQ